MKIELPLSGRPAVDAVRQAIESDLNWDLADSPEQQYFYILRAAQNVGRFEPFTADERALNAYLVQRLAGKRLCDYAWRMFAHSKKS